MSRHPAWARSPAISSLATPRMAVGSRSTLPLTIPMVERRFVAIPRSRAAGPVSARPGLEPKVRSQHFLACKRTGRTPPFSDIRNRRPSGRCRKQSSDWQKLAAIPDVTIAIARRPLGAPYRPVWGRPLYPPERLEAAVRCSLWPGSRSSLHGRLARWR